MENPCLRCPCNPQFCCGCPDYDKWKGRENNGTILS